MIVRRIEEIELSSALELVMSVFLEFEAPDYSEEGVNSFRNSVTSKEYLSMIKLYGAFEDNKLCGVIATRNEGNHIALFFVDGKLHRQGIGRALFNEAVKHATENTITVNSSQYAVEVYKKLGFIATDDEQVVDGIRYTPMKKDLEMDI